MSITALWADHTNETHLKIIGQFVHDLLQELSQGKGPNCTTVCEYAATVLPIPQVRACIAFEGEKPLGVIILNECAAIYAGGRFGEISELYVAPPARSKGVARALLQAAQAEAERRDWKRLEVGAPSQPEWRRSFEFYCREGFEEVGPRLRRLV